MSEFDCNKKTTIRGKRVYCTSDTEEYMKKAKRSHLIFILANKYIYTYKPLKVGFNIARLSRSEYPHCWKQVHYFLLDTKAHSYEVCFSLARSEPNIAKKGEFSLCLSNQDASSLSTVP